MATKKTKQDENELQRIQRLSDAEMQLVYNNLIGEIENVVTWEDVGKQVREIFKDVNYDADIKDITLAGNVSGTVTGLGNTLAISSVESLENYYLDSTYKGATLSDRLRLNTKEAQRVVTKTVKDGLKFKTDWTALTKEITKKTNTVGDISKVIEDLASQGNKYIKGKLSPAELKEFNNTVKRAQRYVSTLSKGEAPTKQLKKAYQNVIDAVNKKDEVLLNKALGNAFDKKIDYNNARVARSELTRAYSKSFHREIEEDDFIIGYRVLLSPQHPEADQCDFVTSVDNGAGPGVYRKGDSVTVPIHPYCLCMLQAVIKRDGQSNPHLYTDTNGRRYLDTLSEKERGQMIGVNNAKKKNRYQEGMDKKGITADSYVKRVMLPKNLVEKVGA